MSAEIATPQANYRPVKISAPRYRFRKIPLYNNGNNSMIIPGGATLQAQWKIGADVYNLKRSFISYQATAAAAGAGTFIYTVQDAPEAFNLLQFTDQGSLPVANIQFARKYARINRKLKTKFDKFMTMDISGALNPSNAPITNVKTLYPAINFTNAVPPVAGVAGTDNLSTNNFVEAQVSINSTAANAAFSWYRQIPLDAYADSIFDVDRDQYFGRDMYLQGDIGNGNYMCWTSTSATDPTAGALQYPSGNNITLSNMYLYLAVEVNDEICRGLKDKYLKSGLTQMISYPYAIRLPTNTANGVANLTYILQTTFGIYCRKIMFQSYASPETGGTLMDCSNFNGQKILNYQTSVESQPLQDIYINCMIPNVANASTTNLTQDDWRENQKYCTGSVIQNFAQYQTNWFHIDRFGEEDMKTNVPQENLVGGLELNVARTWGIQANTGVGAGNLQNYIFADIQRELTVSAIGGIQFDLSKGRSEAPDVRVQ